MAIKIKIVDFFKQISFAERYIEICGKYSNFGSSLDTFEIVFINSFYVNKGLKMRFSKR